MNLFYSKTGIALLLLLGALFWPKSAWASTLYLSPAGGNIGIGSTMAVQIRLAAGGDSVNGVSAYLSYPTDKVDVTYINYGGAFSIAAEGTYGGGSIRISRGNISGVGGDVNVATIGLRGKNLGSATLSFVGGSAAPRATDSSDSLNLGGSSGGTFTIVNAPPPTATSAPTTIKISNITISNIATNGATIAWKTDSPSSSTVEYGLDKDNYLLQSTKNESATDHTIVLQSLNIPAGTKLHFHVRSKDANGNETISPDVTLQLKGYQIKLKVTSSGNPLVNATVFLYSEPFQGTTNSKGEVTFQDITAGKHLVLIKTSSGESSTDISVADNHDFSKAQEFSVKADNLQKLVPVPAKVGPVDIVYVLIGLLILAIGVAVTVYMIKKRRGKITDNFMSPPFPTS